MRKYLLLAIIILQFEDVFGQCTTTIGTENNQEITYFKCDNGYKAPIGFEWMQPTKLYFQYWCMMIGNNCSKSKNFWDHRVCRGENINEVNENWQSFYACGQGGMISRYNKNSNSDLLMLCLDCGLGYYAVVTLLDDHLTNSTIPNQGYGYTCGQPSAELALKAAWQNARKMINKPAVEFTFATGVNAKFEKSVSNNLNQTCYPNVNNSDYIKGFDMIADNADDFVAFIKNSSDWNNYGSNIKGITDKTYPIFTEPINGAKSTGNKTSANKSMQRQENKKENLSAEDKLKNILNDKNITTEKIKQSVINYFLEMGYKVESTDNFNATSKAIYFDVDKTIDLYENSQYGFLQIDFKGKSIPIGQSLLNEIQNDVTSGRFAPKHNQNDPNYFQIVFDINARK